MASSVTTTESVTQVEYKQAVKEEQPKTPTLQLKPVKQDKTIKWAEGTVDNEGMGKKSSKCCCIYKKPRMFGESSSEDESSDEDDKCKGPKDYHKKAKKAKHKEEHDENCNC